MLGIQSYITVLVLVYLNKSTQACSTPGSAAGSHHNLQTRALAADPGIKRCTVPKTFALTYDDGPYLYQNVISDYLTSQNSRGTFFVNGYNWGCIYDPVNVARLKRTFAQGHMIASHSWSHPDITNLNEAELNLQLDLIETALKKILGVVPMYFRAPYGKITNANTKVLKKRGYKIIYWSFDAGDALGEPASYSKALYDTAARNFPLQQIATNHETSSSTASQVTPHAVAVLKKAGFRLVTVAECLGFGTGPHAYYRWVGKPSQRDSSWTCAGTPRPGAKSA